MAEFFINFHLSLHIYILGIVPRGTKFLWVLSFAIFAVSTVIPKKKSSRKIKFHRRNYRYKHLKKNLAAVKKKVKTMKFTVFTSHVIKTKSRNHSVNKFKNLGYDS